MGLVSKPGEGVGSGEWKVESGKWRVESGEWKVESGKRGVESGKWEVVIERCHPACSALCGERVKG